MPSPLQRASSGGAAKRPSETPHGATATIAKSPFFFVGALVLWTFSAAVVVWKILPEKNHSNPAYPGRGMGGGGKRFVNVDALKRPIRRPL